MKSILLFQIFEVNSPLLLLTQGLAVPVAVVPALLVGHRQGRNQLRRGLVEKLGFAFGSLHIASLTSYNKEVKP